MDLSRQPTRGTVRSILKCRPLLSSCVEKKVMVENKKTCNSKIHECSGFNLSASSTYLLPTYMTWDSLQTKQLSVKICNEAFEELWIRWNARSWSGTGAGVAPFTVAVLLRPARVIVIRADFWIKNVLFGWPLNRQWLALMTWLFIFFFTQRCQ